MKAVKCIYCGKLPTIARYSGGLFYAQCPCGHYDLYECLGITENMAISVWNQTQYSHGQYNKGGVNDSSN